MKNVVFMVKNGIGFGHIRRALLLAAALQERDPQIRPIVVSQAHSLDLYRCARVRVVNFPLLHRVPSAITEDCYLEVLDSLMSQLGPAAVVEDTYPDSRYGSLPSLRGVPRVLVMRRLDGLSFDQLREQGAFQRYSRILIAQSLEDFLDEGHSGDTIAGAELSKRTTFIGNVQHVPTVDEINRARQRFCPDGRPLVVASAGAGGDQLHDGFGDQLFSGCAAVAAALSHEGHPARFVLVTGPYYAGRPIQNTSNVTVSRFEPNLPALLATADVAVIKPGNNALSEALLGAANLVLVPDASFMEGVHDHARRIADRFGGRVVKPERDQLDQAIRTALAAPLRANPMRTDGRAIARAVAVIRDMANAAMPTVTSKQLLLLIRDDAGTRVASTATRKAWAEIAGFADSSRAHTVLVGADPPAPAPQLLVEQGARVLILQRGASAAIRRWLRHTPTTPSLITISASTVVARAGDINRASRHVASQLSQEPRAALNLDVSGLPRDEAFQYVNKLLDWLAEQPVELVGPESLTAYAADDLLGGAP